MRIVSQGNEKHSFLPPLVLCCLLLCNVSSAHANMSSDAMGKYQQRRQSRRPVLYLGICLVIFCFFFAFHPLTANTRSNLWGPSRPSRPGLTPELLNNLSLDQDQCDAAFPGLTKEIDDMVAKGPFTVNHTGDLGPLQGRIKDGKVCSQHRHHYQPI